MSTDTQATSKIFDLDDFDASDTADMTILSPDGRLTQWVWTFSGPGHEKGIAQSQRMSRERLHEDAQKEAARVNGKKWKPVEESPDAVRANNADFVVDRLVGWRGGVKGGVEFPFSPENARMVLLDRRKGAILIQALEFLGENASFTQRSETSSAPSPSATSNSGGSTEAEQ